ncbi:hypothetical protein G7054_g7991 [Neopestalotiopsis clavispora]|nr:hypothetical protein G7054_g7991 [Neopestalotiopsis clavispora]
MATPKSGPPSRKHYLDNLRSYCTAHVITHHTAGSFGVGGPDGPPSALFDKPSPLLTGVLAYDLAFGLSEFFWMSGFLSAESLSKSTDFKFAKGKLLRLGLPALFSTLALDPLLPIIQGRKLDWTAVKKAYTNAFRNFKGITGSAWFTATLLALDLCAALFKRLIYIWSLGGGRSPKLQNLGKLYDMICRYGWMAVAAGSFLIRTKFPPGMKMPIIDAQPAYLLQYAYAYALGHLAYQAKKPRLISMLEKGIPEYNPAKPSAKLSILKPVLFSLATLPIVLLPSYVNTWRSKSKASDASEETEGKDKKPRHTEKGVGLSLGGWTATAALYAIWTEMAFNITAPPHTNYFERNKNHPAKTKLFSPRYSYGAFLFHGPVSWVIGETVDAVLCPGGKKREWMKSRLWEEFGPLIMSGVVGGADVVASFGASVLLTDYVPGLNKLI